MKAEIASISHLWLDSLRPLGACMCNPFGNRVLKVLMEVGVTLKCAGAM